MLKTLSKLCSLCLFLFVAQYSWSQENHEQSIYNAFEKYKTAFIQDDVAQVIPYIHPNIIQLGGGAAYIADAITDEINMYKVAGMQLTDIKINQPSKILKSDSSLQAMLPYVKSYKTKSGTVEEKHFFLVTSSDKGGSWQFTDLKQFDTESIQLFVPEYNDRQNIYLNTLKH